MHTPSLYILEVHSHAAKMKMLSDDSWSTCPLTVRKKSRLLYVAHGSLLRMFFEGDHSSRSLASGHGIT
jgi:hypothetical protein